MITFIKKKRDNQTFVKANLEEMVMLIKGEKLAAELQKLRADYPILLTHPEFLDKNVHEYLRFVPEMCVPTEMRHSRGKEKVLQFNHLVLLELTNLPSTEAAGMLRDEVAQIPYTRMAFVGATGRSVHVVVAIRLQADEEPQTVEQMQAVQVQAYRMLHYHYSSQLGICMDRREPLLTQRVHLSADSRVYYEPESLEYDVRMQAVRLPEYKQTKANGIVSDNTLPGYSSLENMCAVYEWCVRAAVSDARQTETSDDGVAEKALTLLARYSCDSNLPIEFVLHRIGWKAMFAEMPDSYVRLVFENAYEEQQSACRPLGKVPSSALLTLRTEAFLKEHYELRRNVMTGVVQYRLRCGYDLDWADLTAAAMNSMTSKALKMGLGSWDKDMQRIVNSNDVPLYEPLADWLLSLPKWDGKDRVTPLIKRLPTDTPNVESWMHLWLCSMVTHWLGRDLSRGNAIVPILIGDQGCGKTSFCASLLPRELRDYYSDRINFKNDTDIMLGLSSSALINIDEFDSVKKSQQPVLKYLVSKGDVRLRLPYGKSMERRRRFASFIGTTNNRHPLTDPSGSRRFLCILIRKGETIDFLSSIDYCQLYAQLLFEVMNGARYWLTDAENRELMLQNVQFQRLQDLNMVIDALFEVPKATEEGTFMTISDLVNAICAAYPEIAQTNNLRVEVGKLMKAKGFERHKTLSNIEYKVVAR